MAENADVTVKRITIDCPGFDAAVQKMAEITKGTGLPEKLPSSTFMGMFTWEFQVSQDKWKEIRPIIEVRLVAMCDQGSIRGASLP
jgi:hypothetical protein